MTSERHDRDPVFRTAKQVVDFLLEEIRLAYMNRDFPRYRKRLSLPHRLGTFDGDVDLKTEEDIRRLFDDMRAYLDERGVIDLARHTVSAQFITSDLIEATFVSRHVTRDYRLSEEVIGHGTLRHENGIWRIPECRYATQEAAFNRTLRRLVRT
ncbi:hypothetical protein [Cognatishimia sp. F0-27]|uniref:hypothetical protein n=1 Tax=Cognatishimia sp. F0-27 TaxID=2816855 RepID=UPI001D0CDC25|nr:hypothetical protein [Cognatishimia sp. F0-27]MCC1494351.1 hypothetical protein [Cognatishimia sp. F0-27]